MAISLLNNSPIVQNQTNTAFKGKYKKTEQGNPYYYTNSGTKVGAVVGGLSGVYWLMAQIGAKTSIDTFKLSDKIDKASKEEFIENINHIKKRAIPLAIASLVCSVGCGMIVDNIRNKKAQEASDLVKKVGVKQALNTNEGLELSDKRKVYYNSNVGSKYGALLGLGCGVIDSALKYNKNSKSKIAYITTPLFFALGGWLVGKLADNQTNKDAQKHA